MQMTLLPVSSRAACPPRAIEGISEYQLDCAMANRSRRQLGPTHGVRRRME
jgi:hypothetical protein